MSAYVSNPETFGILAAYATLNNCTIYEWRLMSKNTLAKVATAQRVARELARENIRSVAHCYPNDKDGARPGPCLLDAEIEEAAALYAAHFIARPSHVRAIKPVQVLVLCQGVDYQSCEPDDWKDTLAWRQLDWIKGRAIRDLPGYDADHWSYREPVPEIEALYAKEK